MRKINHSPYTCTYTCTIPYMYVYCTIPYMYVYCTIPYTYVHCTIPYMYVYCTIPYTYVYCTIPYMYVYCTILYMYVYCTIPYMYVRVLYHTIHVCTCTVPYHTCTCTVGLLMPYMSLVLKASRHQHILNIPRIRISEAVPNINVTLGNFNKKKSTVFFSDILVNLLALHYRWAPLIIRNVKTSTSSPSHHIPSQYLHTPPPHPSIPITPPPHPTVQNTYSCFLLLLLLVELAPATN